MIEKKQWWHRYEDRSLRNCLRKMSQDGQKIMPQWRRGMHSQREQNVQDCHMRI